MEIVYVDQSGKVEQTNMTTVVAATNSKSAAVILRSREKQRLFRDAAPRKRKNLYLRVFTYAIFRAIERVYSREMRIVIDTEYTGKEFIIKSMLRDFLAERYGTFDPRIIVFDRVGRRSKAHLFSVLKITPDDVLVISKEELEEAIG